MYFGFFQVAQTEVGQTATPMTPRLEEGQAKISLYFEPLFGEFKGKPVVSHQAVGVSQPGTGESKMQ